MRAPDFWRRDGILSRFLAPASRVWTWRTNSRIANAAPFNAGIPVICIGNVVAGGAGKTPVAISVMERLQHAGVTAGFLSRGYGGKIHAPTLVDGLRHTSRDVGDEPLLLSRKAPTWIGSDRVQAAKLAVEAGIDALVMDDGLQNPHLHKDLSILVVDGEYGFGNGRVLPAGPLREPVQNVLKRVHAIAIVGPASEMLRNALPDELPILTARFVPAATDDDISGQRVVAFAGIGRPEKFYETLASMGCELIDLQSFPDHHYFSADEVMRLIDRAAAADAIVVTTEKDLVRVPDDARGMVRSLKVRLDWSDIQALDRVLSTVSQAKD
jgi:tetraacyldisaccharide 4'-kinase